MLISTFSRPRRRSQRSSITSLGQNSPVSPFTVPASTSVEIDIKRVDGQQADGMNIEAVDYLTSKNASTDLPIRSNYTHFESPLKGLKVVIIHVKEQLNDQPHVGEKILRELKAHEEKAQLGCDFIISSVGQAVYL